MVASWLSVARLRRPRIDDAPRRTASQHDPPFPLGRSPHRDWPGLFLITRVKPAEGWDGRIELRFLPKYTSQANPIERVWWKLHNQITIICPRKGSAGTSVSAGPSSSAPHGMAPWIWVRRKNGYRRCGLTAAHFLRVRRKA